DAATRTAGLPPALVVSSRARPRAGERPFRAAPRAWRGAGPRCPPAAGAAPAARARARWLGGWPGQRATGPPGRLLLPSRSVCRVSSSCSCFQFSHLLEQLFLARREWRAEHDRDTHELVSHSATLEMRHAVAGEPENAAARRFRRNLHRYTTLEGR